MVKKSKAEKLIREGDKFSDKGDFKKALKKYQKALKEDPERNDLYDKLVDTHDKANPDWNMTDFIESLSWTMKKQELEEPAIKQVHAKLSPEWKQAMDLAFKIFIAPDDETLSKMIEEYIELGEIGTRVLIDIIRSKINNEHDDNRSEQ